jgi:hypothetical protein
MNMTESSTLQQTDLAYRALTKEAGAYVIDLGDLFTAVEQDEIAREKVASVFSKPTPITVLVEGSAFTQNIDIIDKALSVRNNPDDKVILIDISPKSTQDHLQRTRSLPTKDKYSITQGDMNNIPLESGSADLVINDCAINFNSDVTQNTRTISEIKRVMKPNQSICLISAVVPKRYDDSKYGLDQELLPEEEINQPQKFYPLTFSEPSTEISRLCWPSPHYKSQFENVGLTFSEFDVARGKTYFPEKSQISFRRFVLSFPEKV